ncbi:hypothetical protein LHJ74_26990 [Streptomyces sp. N2-109]|uniref:Lipoprotein n=1 Tax=Streptomyces gossypii TaxID=2883101 RepID=A0ABT2K071_9ACTN|nr:hypothetical protein [Streptomyces gossypii]MCT2593506.1 hypothetical protein [Streptomyces gossypii]
MACGGSDSGNEDSVASAGGDKQSSGKKLSGEEKAKKYKACLAERGVAPLSGKVGEDVPEQTASEEEVEAALKACKDYAPTVADGRNQKPTAGELENSRKYVQCLRKNGYDAPDPDPETGGLDVGQGDMGDLDKLKAASEKCRDLNPANQK